MALIERKKRVNPVTPDLLGYLRRADRHAHLPISFADLTRHVGSIAFYDKHGNDTLWETVLYSPSEHKSINQRLVETYALLKVGDYSIMEHLVTDRVDVCTWANTLPYRVRIRNTLNDNFDYLYVKRADSSRIYGLELEHLLSPNRIEFLCDGETVIEEHIAGIPGEVFVREHLQGEHLNAVRLAKEFVKFNERCLVRLLGDMHVGNFVVVVTPDLDDVAYRLRPIDFDQQSYEPRCHVYLPQYFKQNNPIVFLGMECMSVETSKQYREEERTLISHRIRAERKRLRDLIEVMSVDDIAPRENVVQLRRELGEHYGTRAFARCESMGELVQTSLALIG